MSRSFRTLLAVGHRWLALILAPVFVLVLLSGGVLALQPILADRDETPKSDPQALVLLLAQADPGAQTRRVDIPADGVALLRPGSDGGGPRAFDIATRQAIEAPFDLFGFAKRVHEELLVGAGVLVAIAAFALSLIVLAGPFLARLRRPRSLLGWHGAVGWVLLPVIAIGPITGALLTLGIGGPRQPAIGTIDPPVAIAVALDQAIQADVELSRLANARVLPNGAVMLVVRRGAPGSSYLLVPGDGTVTEMDTVPGPLRRIHEGTWAGSWSGLLNLLGVGGLLALLGTGLWSWGSRWRASRMRLGGEDLDGIVAFASQTGRAAQLAQVTVSSLRDGGARIASTSLATLDPAALRRAGRALFLVSTTGDGEVPEQARPFLRRLGGADLQGVGFALLALGDRRYGERNFAAGGKAVREALQAAGARELLPLACADGDPADTWKRWNREAAAALGLRAEVVEAPVGDRSLEVTLVERRRLGDPAVAGTAEVWSLLFESAAELDFRPGDLLLVPPPDGGPERPYSIGSSAIVDPRRLRLTVGLTRHVAADGTERLGQASGLLCRQLQVGDRLQVRLRRHPDFQPPTDPSTPVILVAAGCGLAPFVGFLEEREAIARRQGGAGDVWLVFGNRRAAGDFFYREELEGWRSRGILTRLDTAFDGDPDDGAFAQDRLREEAALFLEWMEQRGAILYVCGRASTLGRGVDEMMWEILVQQGGAADRAAAAAHVARWEAEGRIRRDLFG